MLTLSQYQMILQSSHTYCTSFFWAGELSCRNIHRVPTQWGQPSPGDSILSKHYRHYHALTGAVPTYLGGISSNSLILKKSQDCASVFWRKVKWVKLGKILLFCWLLKAHVPGSIKKLLTRINRDFCSNLERLCLGNSLLSVHWLA